MTLFEYVAIAFSLVFGFSAMRLVGGLPHAIDRERRYWVHLSLVAVEILVTAGVFWAFWSFRKIDWTFPSFVLALANPSLIYFGACTLVPEAPSSVESWHSYYYAIRRKYFVGVALWATVVALAGTFVLDRPLTHPTRIFQASAFGMGVIGAATGDPRVHAGIAAFLICLATVGAFVVFAQPMAR